MKKIFLVIGVLLITFACRLLADEVVLKEGKVLSGTIVQEDKDEVGITLGEGMFLRVDRSNIQSIKRSSEAPPPVPVHKRDAFEPRSTASPSPKKMALPPAPATDVIRSKNMNVDDIVISETIIEKKVSYSGKKLKEAEDAILAALKETAKDEVRLKALHSNFNCAWHGNSTPSGAGAGWKSMNIVSTMTFAQADWSPGPSPKRDETEVWEKIVAQLKIHDDKVLKSYEDAVQDAAQVMTNLQALSGKELEAETNQLVQERIARADRKKRAVDRMTEAALLKIIKN